MYRRRPSAHRSRQQADAASRRPDLSKYLYDGVDDAPQPPPKAIELAVIRQRPPAFGKCRGCEQRIEWVRTILGRLMPIDHPLIALRVHERTDGTTVTTIAGSQSHFATCPEADQFRKKARR